MRRIRFFSFVLLLLAIAAIASAQTTNDSESQKPSDPPAFFNHSADSRFWASGQLNFIFQTHPDFPAKYSGPNSLHSQYEKATSRVLTLFLGLRLSDSTAVIVDVEETGGRGISDALGVAGFTNLDVVRNPSIGQAPYLARVMFHHIFALSSEKQEADRDPFHIFSTLPVRRLEFRAGKFGTADFFDQNSIGSDSHSQFLNWTADNNGAYDYAADTRGYTWGAILDYEQKTWGLRFGELLMPKVANGINIEWNLRRAHAENVEFELRRNFLPKRGGTLRLLGYSNAANMGIYRLQNERYLAGLDPTPVITNHPLQKTRKFGFGANFEQSLNSYVKAFGRFGWNNGKTESYAYTEVDQSVELGAGLDGSRWHRKFDKAGAVFVSNAIAKDHQFYLQHGGLGFLLGDGNLHYGHENIFESFYNAHLWKGLYGGLDLQHINNPGYNRDRGPVLVPGVRLHIEL